MEEKKDKNISIHIEWKDLYDKYYLFVTDLLLLLINLGKILLLLIIIFSIGWISYRLYLGAAIIPYPPLEVVIERSSNWLEEVIKPIINIFK